jgi:hypothetical protein
MKYHIYINVKNHDLKHAGSKAIEDCNLILHEQGYQFIQLNFYKYTILTLFNVLKLLIQFTYILLTVKPKALIVLQYPLYGLKGYFKVFIKGFQLKGCFVSCIVHDINSLRYQQGDKQIKSEVENLSVYNAVISHNPVMTAWLKGNGLKSKILDLQIFDYLSNQVNRYDRINSFKAGKKEVVFAGNLSRGAFLYQLHAVAKNLTFNLYGPGLKSELLENQQNVLWSGSFNPNELIEKIEGNFGLIWDGETVEECSGQFGEYIGYNNPHKLSLYLVSGLPVIIPLKAALSKFVIENNLGIAVNSLLEVNGLVSAISTDAYTQMVKNINLLGDKLKLGYFLKLALSRIEKLHAD